MFEVEEDFRSDTEAISIRSSPVAPSTLTLKSRTRIKESFLKENANARATMSLLPTPSENILSVLRMICRLLRTSSWISISWSKVNQGERHLWSLGKFQSIRVRWRRAYLGWMGSWWMSRGYNKREFTKRLLRNVEGGNLSATTVITLRKIVDFR